MTGDWGGARTRLNDAGINLRADFVSETFSGIHGGERRGDPILASSRQVLILIFRKSWA
ncbi:MAG: hypothetical protein LCH61_09855 [Proteobacteria bacterium]|nr:hypothetical protein [Pseudomonadota bacterium]